MTRKTFSFTTIFPSLPPLDIENRPSGANFCSPSCCRISNRTGPTFTNPTIVGKLHYPLARCRPPRLSVVEKKQKRSQFYSHVLAKLSIPIWFLRSSLSNFLLGLSKASVLVFAVTRILGRQVGSRSRL